MGRIADAVAGALAEADERGLTTRGTARTVKEQYDRVPVSRVESVLRGDPRFEQVEDPLEPRVGRWRLRENTGEAPDGDAVRADGDTEHPLDGLDLWDWQVDAFTAWAAEDCRGVVEAVTGTGKTRLAVTAVRAALANRGRAVVLVPTLDLMDQWRARLREHVPGASVGNLGGGGDDDLHANHVVIATPHSAADVPIDLPGGAGPGLLVADEAHRYGAPTWGGALKPNFAMRLALTATYERTDDGLAEILDPYFTKVVYRYRFADARADGTIAPFSVAFAATSLGPAEQRTYDAADTRLRRHRSELVDAGLPRHPLRMIEAASRISASAQGTSNRQAPRDVIAARGFLSALRARRDVAATCAGKLDLLAAAAPGLADRRILVFTDTVDQATEAARLLSGAGVTAEAIHGGLGTDDRRAHLSRFAAGDLPCVVAPRVLDEGIDVPDADVAVVLAAFRTRRQMVQRLGRVLRRKPDGRQARLLVAYAKGTREDPDDGAHEDFLDEVVGVAESVDRLETENEPGAVAAWLSSG